MQAPGGIKQRLNYNHALTQGMDTQHQILPSNAFVNPTLAALKLPNRTAPTQRNGESFIKMCQDMLPTLASKLSTDFPVEEKPIKYDIQLQQVISEIQGKPLMYKCAGSDVVTFDGPGINVDVKPHTTERTLNQRFA